MARPKRLNGRDKAAPAAVGSEVNKHGSIHPLYEGGHDRPELKFWPDKLAADASDDRGGAGRTAAPRRHPACACHMAESQSETVVLLGILRAQLLHSPLRAA